MSWPVLRIGAVLEHIEPSLGQVRRKEKLLSSITADDDDDEILPEVDTFALFTERATGTQPRLDIVKLGPELNNQIEELTTEFEPQNLFRMTLPRESALIKHFEIKVDEKLLKFPQNRLPPRVQTPEKNKRSQKAN